MRLIIATRMRMTMTESINFINIINRLLFEIILLFKRISLKVNVFIKRIIIFLIKN